ncbi:monovalent cation/H(+) antiporter subunit G [Leucobacter aridicollis]|uniref:Multicomponent Na+:H+ antiporter subunit G n=1 Tax=Leucobacter aridicollis TaxID=283878 RepID=A0A852RIK4_9MICO|nr:monovalent cation/H(+) antiporter subunit G [Leucobacter aridicollis]MBL3683832.1 monovalent cation/H(+) antiporter subunit G [Leucobacter aridicollis]NYD26512.1 multicomponent Na+:H+ antiporter subunit G [Leucobacter aridicollis]
MFDQILDVIALICLLLAAALSAAAGIGLLRFTDALSRLHAATKPQIFGLLLVVAAVAIDQRSLGVFLALVPVFVFQALTAPTAAHMVGRAAYRTGQLDSRTILVDELGPAVERATARAAEQDREQALAEEARDRELEAEHAEGDQAPGRPPTVS